MMFSEGDYPRRDTLESFIATMVSDKVSLLCTDDFAGYQRVGKYCPHGVIDHGTGKHVVGAHSHQHYRRLLVAD